KRPKGVLLLKIQWLHSSCTIFMNFVSNKGRNDMAISVEAAKTQTSSKRLNPWLRSETWFAFLFIFPSLIGFTFFYAVPAVRGLLISFTDWDLLTTPKPVGLANYQKLIVDIDFWKALWVTLQYVVINIFFQTVMATII